MKKRIKGWLNIYQTVFHETRKIADAAAASSRLACIYIDIEEGEGLEEEKNNASI